MNTIPSLLPLLLVAMTITPTLAYGTNESSYKFGYQRGSESGPIFKNGCLNENTEMGTYCTMNNANGVTNTTACQDGFFNGWKNWCSNHAVDCVQNFTIGDSFNLTLAWHPYDL
jgi:hypothetical protein